MKLKMPAKNINIPILAGIILIVVVALEVYLAYAYIYRQMNPQANFGGSSGIIRINRTGFSEASKYLDSLYQFEPPEPKLIDNNPFQY